MIPGTIVVASCGSRKLPRAALARDLYCGPYARHCIDYAIALYATLAVGTYDAYPFILSAKHGFVEIHRMLDPYDVALGQPDAITPDALRAQIEHRGWLACADVRVLGGSRYVRMVQQVWPHAVPVIPAGLGMGDQMRWMNQHPPRPSATTDDEIAGALDRANAADARLAAALASDPAARNIAALRAVVTKRWRAYARLAA